MFTSEAWKTLKIPKTGQQFILSMSCLLLEEKLERSGVGARFAGFGQFGPDCKLPDICSVVDRLNMDYSLVLQNMT